MATNDSLGFVEVFGLVAAVETADAMAKAARVRVKTVANADAGMISVICEGDLASCKAAVDAGKAAATRIGKVFNSNLIPRPGEGVDNMIVADIGSVFDKAETAPKTPKPKVPKAKPKPKAESSS